MDFLKTVKRRSFLSELVYVILNIGLAVALVIIVRTTNSLLLAFALVLLSKWRILAVRPRFWVANIQANMVSIIVSISMVVLLYTVNLANGSDFKGLMIQIGIMLLYIGWLLFLKPKSKRRYVIMQAGVALFFGITAIYTMSYSWIATPVVLLVWLVGYVSARHVLNTYDEDYALMLSLSWGLVMAEIGWLAYHWTIAYRLPIVNSILVPQVSIVILCLGFLASKSYDSFYHHQKVRSSDIILPLIFTVGIIAALMLIFNGISTGVV